MVIIMSRFLPAYTLSSTLGVIFGGSSLGVVRGGPLDILLRQFGRWSGADVSSAAVVMPAAVADRRLFPVDGAPVAPVSLNARRRASGEVMPTRVAFIPAVRVR
jgi:predicted MFS family arabinose efflux permease